MHKRIKPSIVQSSTLSFVRVKPLYWTPLSRPHLLKTPDPVRNSAPTEQEVNADLTYLESFFQSPNWRETLPIEPKERRHLSQHHEALFLIHTQPPFQSQVAIYNANLIS